MKRILLCTAFMLIFAVFADYPANYSSWRFTEDFQVFHSQKLTRDDAAKAEYGKSINGLDCKKI